MKLPENRQYDSSRLLSGLALLGIFANAAGNLLYRPQGPDVWQSPLSLAGAFLLFLSALCAQVAWGDALSRLGKWQPSLWESFFLGSAFVASLLAVLGFLPLVGASARPAWNLFLGTGCVLCLALARYRPRSPLLFSLDPVDGIALLALGLALLGASSPHPFWDSLWYHLTASRLWFEASRVYLPPAFPVALKTGLWDYHFLLGQILLGQPGEAGGLIAAQLFGQWSSFSCALFSYLLLRSAGRLFGLSPFSALAGVLGSEVFLMAEFAKNDWAAVFWGLCALAFALESRSFLLVAWAAGLCFASKYSSAFFLLPVLAWQAWAWRARPAKIAAGAGLFLLAALPLLARNSFFTGNPFFPALEGLFPGSLLGPSWRHISDYEGFTLGTGELKEKLGFLLTDSKALLGLCLLPFGWRVLGRGRVPFFLSALSALLFLLCSGPKAEWRIAGACLPLLACYGARALELACLRLPGKAAQASPVFLGLLALVLFPVDWNAANRLGTNATLRIRSGVSGEAMAWVRLHAPPEALAATLNEQRIYYLFPHPPIRAFDDPNLDSALARSHGAEEMILVFRAAHIRYLVLSAEFLDRYYDRRVCDEISLYSERVPKAVVFRSALSRVLDLDLLP